MGVFMPTWKSRLFEKRYRIAYFQIPSHYWNADVQLNWFRIAEASKNSLLDEKSIPKIFFCMLCKKFLFTFHILQKKRPLLTRDISKWTLILFKSIVKCSSSSTSKVNTICYFTFFLCKRFLHSRPKVCERRKWKLVSIHSV